MRCHRHPEREGKRRCYRCHKPICPSCQVRASHHFFCSSWCILLFGFQDRLRNGLHNLRSAFGIPSFPARENPGWILSPLFLVILSAIMVVLFFQQKAPSFRGFVQPLPGRVCSLKSSVSEPLGVSIRPAAPNRPGTSSVLRQPACSPLRTSVKKAAFLWRDESRQRVWSKKGGNGSEGEEGGEVPDISRGDPHRKEIALTFDGGGWANTASEILQILREKGVTSTFFLTGEFIRRYPDLVKQMIAEGHEIANHTYDHPHLTSFAHNYRHELLPGVDRRFLWRELRETEEAFFDLTGRKMAPFWRAPYGEQNATLRRWAGELGYRHISWTSDYRGKTSLDSRDWVADRSLKIYCSAEEVRDRILGYGDGANGGIVLMHLGTSRAQDRVHERLGEIIEGLRERGYRLIKVSELLEGGVMGEGS